MKCRKKFAVTLFILLVIMCSLSACLDEEDSEYDEYYEGYSDDYSYSMEGDAGNAQESFANQESFQSTGDNDGYHAPNDWRQLYPNGSAGRLSGTIAVVSIFVSANGQDWDFDDESDFEEYSKAYSDLKCATEFLEKECAGYGKEVKFIWDWMENKRLYNTATLNVTYNDVLSDAGVLDYAVWQFIDNYIDSEGIRQSLGADSVVYMAYYDAPEGNTQPSCARNFYEGMPYPYEICEMQMRDEYGLTVPSVFAHEMLHLFGAPDLYWTDTYSVFELQYGITKEFTDYAKSTGLDDIMRTIQDPVTYKLLPDSVPLHITEITAYYTGLIDQSDLVDQWGFEPSQHVR